MAYPCWTIKNIYFSGMKIRVNY